MLLNDPAFKRRFLISLKTKGEKESFSSLFHSPPLSLLSLSLTHTHSHTNVHVCTHTTYTHIVHTHTHIHTHTLVHGSTHKHMAKWHCQQTSTQQSGTWHSGTQETGTWQSGMFSLNSPISLQEAHSKVHIWKIYECSSQLQQGLWFHCEPFQPQQMLKYTLNCPQSCPVGWCRVWGWGWVVWCFKYVLLYSLHSTKYCMRWQNLQLQTKKKKNQQKLSYPTVTVTS